jgi:hypothetical protein
VANGYYILAVSVVIAALYPIIVLVACSVGNVTDIDSPRRARTFAEERKSREVMQQWLTLPIVAYIAAIVCNVGSNYLIEDLHASRLPDLRLLAAGAGWLEFCAFIALLRLPIPMWRQATVQQLWAEVTSQSASNLSPERDWLIGVTDRYAKFKGAEATRFGALLRPRQRLKRLPRPEYGPDYRKSPRFGFWRPIWTPPPLLLIEWSIRRPALAVCLVVQVLGLLAQTSDPGSLGP